MALITLAEAAVVITKYRQDLDVNLNTLDTHHLEFASEVFDQMDWVGRRTDGGQATGSWPRTSVPIDRFDHLLGNRPSDVVPEEIQLACAELAIRFLLKPAILNDSTKVVKVTGVEVQGVSYDVLGDHIRASIRPFVKNTGGVWRIN